jgi:hypothetical protein
MPALCRLLCAGSRVRVRDNARSCPQGLLARTAMLLSTSMVCVKAPSLTNSLRPSLVFLEPCRVGRGERGWGDGVCVQGGGGGHERCFGVVPAMQLVGGSQCSMMLHA